jgi:hypothetical protein
VSDGGKLVDRWTVYNKPTTDSHYMALAVKPAADASDTGDFHFWKLDADKSWSYKVQGCVIASVMCMILADVQLQYQQFPVAVYTTNGCSSACSLPYDSRFVVQHASKLY